MKIRVLIFDDEVSIRRLFRIALERRGYEIFDFDNPSICPLYTQELCGCPSNKMCADIIISDIRMPSVDGISFIREQKEKGCKVQNVLITSAYIDPYVQKEVEELGCVCLKKPFHIDQFNAIIDMFEKNIDPDRELTEWNHEE